MNTLSDQNLLDDNNAPTRSLLWVLLAVATTPSLAVGWPMSMFLFLLWGDWPAVCRYIGG